VEQNKQFLVVSPASFLKEKQRHGRQVLVFRHICQVSREILVLCYLWNNQVKFHVEQNY